MSPPQAMKLDFKPGRERVTQADFTYSITLDTIPITPEIVKQHFPSAVRWVTKMEKDILERGEPLAPENRKDAEAIRIQRIEDVRIIVFP